MSFGRVDPSAQIAYADDGGSKQAWIWWFDADGDHYVGGGDPGNDAYAAQRQDNTIIVAQYFLDPTGNLGLSYIVNSMYAPTMGDWNTRRGKIYL